MHFKQSSLFTRTLFIALIAIVTMGWVNYSYSFFMHQPRINWSITGRWVMMLAHGQFYTPNINLLPYHAHDWLLGFTFHIAISFLFALSYLLFLNEILKKEASLLNGIGFSLTLMILPLFIQFPSMGNGIAGLDSSNPELSLLRTFICHASFGFGLGLGGVLSKTKE